MAPIQEDNLLRFGCGKEGCSSPDRRHERCDPQDLHRAFHVVYTPCRFNSTERQAAALAIAHAELILIYPFRDGNGRCARLLAMLMGLQAGLPALDFGGIRGEKNRRYIGAVHSAMDHNYAPMTEMFREPCDRHHTPIPQIAR